MRLIFQVYQLHIFQINVKFARLVLRMDTQYPPSEFSLIRTVAYFVPTGEGSEVLALVLL